MSRYHGFIEEYGEPFQLLFLAPTSLYFMDSLKLIDRLSTYMASVQQKMIQLYGSKKASGHARMYLAQLISFMALLLLLLIIVSAIVRDLTLFVSGLGLVLFMPLFMIKQLERNVLKRKRRLLIELPEFLSKLTLLVNAGETVQEAMIRCAVHEDNIITEPLYYELRQVVNDLNHQYSFQQSLEDFSKRCGIQEVSIFTSTVLLNYRRGGDQFVLALKQLSDELWNKRKALARILGEEASSKLVFPMMFIFIVVMVIVAAPAILLME